MADSPIALGCWWACWIAIEIKREGAYGPTICTKGVSSMT